MPRPSFGFGGLTLNGESRECFMVRTLKNHDAFVMDENYNLEDKGIIYDSKFYTVVYGYHRTTLHKVEMIKYHDLLRKNWNWKLSLKILNELKVYNTLTDQTKMLTLTEFMLAVKSRTAEDEYRKIFNCEFRDIYLEYERFGNDLGYILLSNTSKDEMKAQQQEWILSELLSAVSSLHSQKLIHRDLRPCNVSVSLEKKILKLRSFGLSCGLSSNFFLEEDNDEEDEEDEEEDNDEDDERTTDEIKITPIYTPPEIVLGLGGASSPSVDVWGVGCIFAEILMSGGGGGGGGGEEGGSPLFFLPSGTMPTVFTKIGAIVGTLQQNRGSSIDKLSPNPLAIDLLKRMLDLNPRTRISVEEAKQHPYFGGTEEEKQELVVGGGSSKVAEADEDMGVVVEEKVSESAAAAGLGWVEVTEPQIVVGGGSSSRVAEADENMGVAVEEEVTESAAAIGGLGWVEVTEPDVHSLRKLFWKEMKIFEMKRQQTSELLL